MAAKIKRDAFLYLNPKGRVNDKEHAQCSTCMMWTGPKANTCTIHGDVTIHGGDSCGLYVEGKPMPSMAGKEHKSVTPEESGLVDRQVRCENCEYGSAEKICKLFQKLNDEHPAIFDLNARIEPLGCCNAQIPKTKSIQSLRDKAASMD